MIAWEDNLLALISHFLLFAVLIYDYRHFLLFLSHDVSLQYSQKHISAQHVAPQIARHIFVVLSLWVSCSSHISCSVASLVERHEVSLLSLQLRSHSSLVEVATEVGEYAVVEMEERFLRVAVVLPLLYGVVDVLVCELVFQL